MNIRRRRKKGAHAFTLFTHQMMTGGRLLAPCSPPTNIRSLDFFCEEELVGRWSEGFSLLAFEIAWCDCGSSDLKLVFVSLASLRNVNLVTTKGWIEPEMECKLNK